VLKHRIALLLPLLLISAHLSAATAQQQIDDRLRQESQKRIYEQLKRQQQEKLTPFQKPAEQPPKAAVEGRCISISVIDVVGATLLNQEKIDGVVDKYNGRCLHIQDLDALTAELTALYIDKGYITSMAYLKEQDVSDGQVEISVMEGKIEKIGDESPGLLAAFLGQKGEYLNLRDLEVSLDRINRLPSHHAKLDMLPGSSEGWSVVDVPIERQRPWRVTLSANNYGSDETGETQGALSLQWDNPLGLFDQLTIQTNSTVPHEKRLNTESQVLSYSIPFGRSLFTYSYSDSKYKQLVKVGTTELQSEGRSKSHDYSLDYRLFHDAKHRFDIGAYINTYKTESYLADALMTTSSYDLSKLGLSLSHLYQIDGFTTALQLTYIKGLDDFGAEHETELNEKYEAWQLDGTLVKRISSLTYILTLHSQYTQESQFGANQISIGGPYSVRGFNENGLSGNTGAYLRNELTIPVVRRDNGWMELYLALDAGWIKKDQDTIGGSVVGGAIGMRANLAGLNIDLFYSSPIDDHDAPDNHDFAGLSLSYQY
jgi:hemolysin activation/secretion protein